MNPRVPTVSVEAGTTHGWTDWTGRCGANIGIDRFGESGPGDKVYEHFGFTVENVVKTVKELVDEGCCSL